MSRRRDREKRLRRITDPYTGNLVRAAQATVADKFCFHPPDEFIAAGWKCPNAEGWGCCMEVPF